MPTTIETMDEANWRLGNNFTYFYAGKSIQPEQIIHLAICAGNDNIVLNKIEFTGDTSLITYTWYANSNVTVPSGTPIIEIPLNEIVNSSSGSQLLLNPTISDVGTQVVNGDIDAIGMIAARSRMRLQKTILTKNLTIPKNTNHIIKIRNRDPEQKNINVMINLFKMTS